MSVSPRTLAAIIVVAAFAIAGGCKFPPEKKTSGTEAPGTNATAAPAAESTRAVKDSWPAKGVEGLRIQCSPGSLVVICDPNAQTLEFTGEINTTAKNTAEAKRLRDEIRVTFGASGTGRATLIANDPEIRGTDQRFSIDLTVKVPPKVHLVIVDGEGTLDITGVTSGAEITKTGAGAVTLRTIQGDVALNSRGGPTVIDQVTGNIAMEDGPGDIIITNVTGNVDVGGGGGVMIVRNVEGNVIGRNNPAGMEMRGVEGNLTLYDIDTKTANVEAVTGRIEFLSSAGR